MKLKNNFVGSKLNKDLDERLIPKGQYPHALNINISNSDGSDVGALENIKGNELLTNLNLTNAFCIGATKDDSNRKIYWFVTSSEKDLVLEYDYVNSRTNVLLESSSGGVLNFNKNFLITGVNKVINENSEKDLLFWTDNYNPPRVINISRFKNSLPNSFTEADISVIKAPPLKAPEISFTFDIDSSLDSLEDKFLSFAYRYKYLDGEYSALSSFTNYAFYPSNVSIDNETLENKGMRNIFNAVNVVLNSGGSNIKEVQLVVKESSSNTVYIVETFIKEEDNINDNEDISYKFINNKILRALPEDEIFRSYDNVPRKALSQEIVGSRLMYGNYTEGFNVGKVDYTCDIVSADTDVKDLFSERQENNQSLYIELKDLPLKRGVVIKFDINLLGVLPLNVNAQGSASSFNYTFYYVLERDYTNYNNLVLDESFVNFFEVVMTSIFDENENSVPPVDTFDFNRRGFVVIREDNGIKLLSPRQDYDLNDSSIVSYFWNFLSTCSVTYSETESLQSLKSNRSLEVGIIYMDEYGRKSTVLLSKNNTVNIPQDLSYKQNKLKVTIPKGIIPPLEAVKYKFAVKQNKGFYENVFCTRFFPEGNFRWVKLEEANKDKVKAGDVLYVKRDTSGLILDIIKTTVLEVSYKEENFIPNNYVDKTTGQVVNEPNVNTQELVEPAGLYMKIKPINFVMEFDPDSFYDRTYHQGLDENLPTVKVDAKKSSTEFVTIGRGDTISLDIYASKERTNRWSRAKLELVSNNDYNNFRDYYIAEVGLQNVQPTSVGSGIPFNQSFPVSTNVDGSIKVTDSTDGIRFYGLERGGGKRFTSSITVKISIRKSNGLTVFETTPNTNLSEIYYETSETFDIEDGLHKGKERSQTINESALHTLDFFNCFVMGDGIECISYLDTFNKPFLNIDLKPCSTSIEKFSEVNRISDITYSEIYNENSNINGLNEFNLAKANYKDDINKEFGSIQKLYSRDTDLVVFQEDKVSKVLFGKDLLLNADATSNNVTNIDNVLSQQVPFSGEYGISFNPESFSFNGNHIYFTDIKRGCVCRLGYDGIEEISQLGMRRYFIDSFKNTFTLPKLGVYDPYNDEYIINTGQDTLSYSNSIKGWISFFSFLPDYFVSMNNDLYSFKNGNLYLHNSDNVLRNNFYGVQYHSEIDTIFNDSPSEIKGFKAMSLEGNDKWDVDINSYIDMSSDSIKSSIKNNEFVQKEGLWFAYCRRNENSHFDSKSSYGLGNVISISGTGNTFEITLNNYSKFLTVGDIIVSQSLLPFGVLKDVILSGNLTKLIVDTFNYNTILSIGNFIFGNKNSRYEGGLLRGYVARFKLKNYSTNKVELFSVNTEVFKSFP